MKQRTHLCVYLFIYSFFICLFSPSSLPSGLLQPLQARVESSLRLFSDLSSFSVIFFFPLTLSFSSVLWASRHVLTSFWFGRQTSLRLFGEESGELHQPKNGIKMWRELVRLSVGAPSRVRRHLPDLHVYVTARRSHKLNTYVYKKMEIRALIPVVSPNESGGENRLLKLVNLKTYIVVSCWPARIQLHVKLSLFPGQLIILGLLLPW